MWGRGIGRHRTKLAKFLASYDYSIQDFSKASKVNRNTLCTNCVMTRIMYHHQIQCKK